MGQTPLTHLCICSGSSGWVSSGSLPLARLVRPLARHATAVTKELYSRAKRHLKHVVGPEVIGFLCVF